MTKQKETKPRGMRKLYALGEKRSIDLSLSENPLGCSSLVVEKLKTNNFDFNDYPAPNGTRLKRTLAKKLGCLSENIFVCNGSEAIINTIPKVFAPSGTEAVVPQLSFPMFSICSELAGLYVRFAPMTEELGIDLAATEKLVNQNTKLIFICNPNNPTGAVIARDKLIEFVEQVPQSVLVVIDEANIEFGGESASELATAQPNVMVLRTLSKGFGLANLRIGFAIANEQLIAKLEEETPVFPVSGLSEELGIAALSDDEFIAKTKRFLDTQRNKIRDELIRLGFTVFPSQANNLFVKLPKNLATSTFWAAMAQADISLVKGTSFTGFYDNFFRVSPRLSETNDVFLIAVNRVIS